MSIRHFGGSTITPLFHTASTSNSAGVQQTNNNPGGFSHLPGGQNQYTPIILGQSPDWTWVDSKPLSYDAHTAGLCLARCSEEERMRVIKHLTAHLSQTEKALYGL